MTITTRTTTNPNDCSFEETECCGPLWECDSCKRLFCTGRHSHVTEKGYCMECRECEISRQADEVPDPESHPAMVRLAMLDDTINRLDIKDK